MSKVPDKGEALERVQAEIHAIVTRHRLPRAGGATSSQDVVDYIRRAAADPENLVRGQLLTRFLQLPHALFSRFAPSLKDEFVDNKLGLKVTVRNESSKPIDVMYSRDHREHIVKDSVGWVSGSTGYFVDHKHKLMPGKTIDLDPHYAILALQEHSASGNPPMYWGESGAIETKDNLVEVAYRLSVPGPDGEPIDSRNYTPPAADVGPPPAGDRDRRSSSSRRSRSAE